MTSSNASSQIQLTQGAVYGEQKKRNRMIIVVGSVITLIAFVVLLVLMIVAYVKLGQQKCLPTKSHYAILLDPSQTYDDGLGDNSTDLFKNKKKDYEIKLSKSVKEAGYISYYTEVFKFRANDPLKTYLAHEQGLWIYAVIVIEGDGQPANNILRSTLQAAANKLNFTWIFSDAGDDATLLCGDRYESSTQTSPTAPPTVSTASTARPESSMCSNQCGMANKNEFVTVTVDDRKVTNRPDIFQEKSPYLQQLTVSLSMRNLAASKTNSQPFNFTTKFSLPYGDMVTSINGIFPKENQYWKLSVNNVDSMCGIDFRILNSGDVVQWALEEFSANDVPYHALNG